MFQLYSEKEKQSKEDLLNLMTCYDLQFVQHRSTEGLSQYMLEPDLYSLTRFSGVQEVKQLPYSVKQMLAREVRHGWLRFIRVVATTPEKTHYQKFLTFETILNRLLVQFYPGLKKIVATPTY